MAESNVPLWTRETTWRQGHVLLPETSSALNLIHLQSPDATCVVVVSHDCDIAQDNLTVEPCIEVIVGRRIARIDHNYTLTKNPRVLHLEMKRGDTLVAVELDASRKLPLQKLQLADWTPDPDHQLVPADLFNLKRWLGVRYNRAVFPNEFERRLRDLNLRDKIEKALKSANEIISAIYFELNPNDEISPEKPYELTVALLYEAGKSPDRAADRAGKVADQISSDFESTCYVEKTNSWQHFKLKDCIAMSEDDATIAQVKYLQQWRLDQWSFKPGVTAALPPALDT